jgi:hypothetical protein
LSSNGTLFIHSVNDLRNDARTARQFSILNNRDLFRPGMSLIHAIVLKEGGFRAMTNASVGFVCLSRNMPPTEFLSVVMVYFEN